jgi:hypothetical protein
MKKLVANALLLCLFFSVLASCYKQNSGSDESYLQVIGEYEQATPDGSYRLTLSYNGPISMQKKFQTFADSLQKQMPDMVKIHDNIYINYMPEQMGKKISDEMYQVGVGYNLIVTDSATYNRIAKDLQSRLIPFSLNMTGAFVDPKQKTDMQKDMLQKALDNAKTKLDFLKQDSNLTYQIVAIEELDSQPPYGPEYYDFNRRMVTRVKVKARLNQ